MVWGSLKYQSLPCYDILELYYGGFRVVWGGLVCFGVFQWTLCNQTGYSEIIPGK